MVGHDIVESGPEISTELTLVPPLRAAVSQVPLESVASQLFRAEVTQYCHPLAGFGVVDVIWVYVTFQPLQGPGPLTAVLLVHAIDFNLLHIFLQTLVVEEIKLHRLTTWTGFAFLDHLFKTTLAVARSAAGRATRVAEDSCTEGAVDLQLFQGLLHQHAVVAMSWRRLRIQLSCAGL